MRPQIARLFTWRTAITESDLAPTTRHVLLTLSLHMSEAGNSCFPSTLTLARETGLSERAICTHLEKAEASGWLIKRRHQFAGQAWRRNEYEARVPREMLDQLHQEAENALNHIQHLEAEALNDVQHERTEPDSVPLHAAPAKALNVVPKGTEPDDRKALNDVQSSTSVNSTKNTTRAPAGKRKRTSLPAGFEISDRVRLWAERKGYTHLEARLEDFTLKATAKGYQYVDWDAAFMNAIRDDWARLNSQQGATENRPRGRCLNKGGVH